jgi:PAS domain S-box-containing protein
MKLFNFILIFLISLALCLFVFLFNQARNLDFQQHDNFTSNLLRIKEIDALLNQDVVKSRSGLLTYYDPLANNFAELKKRQKKLNQIPTFIERLGQIEIKKLLELQREAYRQKEQLIEQFKSQESILKNSLYYFPTLTTELAEKASQRGDKRLADQLENLLKDVLIYNLTPSEELAPQIQGQLGVLLTTRSQYSDKINGADIDRVILHGKTILTKKPKVDDLVQKIVSQPTSHRSEEVYKVYNQYYEKALKRVSLYRMLLSLFYVVIIGTISAYIIIRLVNSAKTVSAAKEKLQQALLSTQSAEEKFRSIYENSTDGIFQTTPDGKYISANPTLARIYGYSSPEELIASIDDIKLKVYVDPNRRSEFIAAMEKHNTISQFESQVYRKDGSITWISENARAVKDDKGVLLYYEGTVEDIAQRKLTEGILQESEIKLRLQQLALMELSKCHPLYEGDLDAALREITETAAFTLGVERVSVWFYNEDASKLHCVDLYQLSSNQHAKNFELSESDYPGYFKALETAERAIAANDAHTDPRTCEFAASYLPSLGIYSMLDVPIRLGKRTVGVLCHEHVGYPREWTLQEENFASYLGYMASLAMEASDRKKAQAALRLEQEKAEALLLNILPEPIAQRLKQQQGSIADSFDQVSVLFADIVGFTQLSSQISAEELVNLLNQIFSAFDHLVDRHGLEKIKTIGDAYMVVSGLPIPRGDHAEAIAEMALDMQQAVINFTNTTGIALNIRIGIHSGPVVAGVIGIKKFIYDLWGDTVNIASRMESQGIPGHIQVTGFTYELLQHKYHFQHRGIIQVKGKGEMKTYLLNERKYLL